MGTHNIEGGGAVEESARNKGHTIQKEGVLWRGVQGMGRTHNIFDKFYLIKLHETCRASHNNSVNKRIVKGYTLQIMQKICINQKGFGQGMGATNAQNQVKQI